MVSYFQSLLANFVSGYYRITTWPPQKKKKIASSCFQHLSAKFALFWFWSHPITKLETGIQKWLWPELLYGKQNNTWLIVDMEFLFSCSTRHLTRLLRSLVCYRVKHSMRNSISTRPCIILSLSLSLSLSFSLSMYIYIYFFFLLQNEISKKIYFRVQRRII